MALIPNPNERAKVIITSLAHNKEAVQFFPYDFEFDDNYKPEWNSYEAFGRMDPIMVYKRTSREVNLNFNVVAESDLNDSEIGNVEFNFKQLQNLIKFLYPVYQTEPEIEKTISNLKQKADKTKAAFDIAGVSGEASAAQQAEFENAGTELQKAENLLTQAQLAKETLQQFGSQTIKKSPLVTVSFMNLLNNAQYVAAITSFKHKMKFDVNGSKFTKEGKAYPGEFNINLGLKIIHTSIPGQFINYNMD